MHNKQNISIKDLAKIINIDIPIDDFTVNDFSVPAQATVNSIVYLANKQFLAAVNQCPARVVLTSPDFTDQLNQDKIALVADDLPQAFIKLLDYFEDKEPADNMISIKTGIKDRAQLGKNISISDFAHIAEGVVIGDNTVIHPFVYIGKNVAIGSDCIIHPHVTIYKGTKIGNKVIIHANTVIGSDGFGYAQVNKQNVKIPQIGNVEIGNNVEIGACTTIDRGTLGSTIIKDGVKIDNLVQIAHNTEIGENSIVAALTGISGSSKIGKNCILLGQVGVADHAVIEDNVIVGAKTGVPSRVVKSEEKMVFGAVAKPLMQAKRIEAIVAKLPEFYKEFEDLKKKIIKE